MFKIIFNSFALKLTLFSASFALASIEDITLVRSLLPARTDLAQYQMGLLKKIRQMILRSRFKTIFFFTTSIAMGCAI